MKSSENERRGERKYSNIQAIRLTLGLCDFTSVVYMYIYDFVPDSIPLSQFVCCCCSLFIYFSAIFSSVLFFRCFFFWNSRFVIVLDFTLLLWYSLIVCRLHTLSSFYTLTLLVWLSASTKLSNNKTQKYLLVFSLVFSLSAHSHAIKTMAKTAAKCR